MHFQFIILVLIILFNVLKTNYLPKFCDKEYYNSKDKSLVEMAINTNKTLYLFRHQNISDKKILFQWDHKSLNNDPTEVG